MKLTPRYSLLAIGVLLLFGATFAFAGNSPICPTTSFTNSDCGYILTINPGGSVTGALVTVSGNPANAYDGSDDALVGIINNSGQDFSGAISLSGSSSDGGIFEFEGDGICTFTNDAYCATAATGYEGPLTTFSNLSSDGTSGDVNVSLLAAGQTTFFSLEGSPANIATGGGIQTGVPEPSSFMLLASGLLGLAGTMKRRVRK